uniref:IF rod domain-containing protein n=1 Tax=Anolis carolinensis TaxID=28377 RepID=A0A803T230_ANOCA
MDLSQLLNEIRANYEMLISRSQIETILSAGTQVMIISRQAPTRIRSQSNVYSVPLSASVRYSISFFDAAFYWGRESDFFSSSHPTSHHCLIPQYVGEKIC